MEKIANNGISITNLFEYNDGAGPGGLGDAYFNALKGIKVNGTLIFDNASSGERLTVGKMIQKAIERDFPQVAKTRSLINNLAEAHHIADRDSIDFFSDSGFHFKQSYKIKSTKTVELPDSSGGVMKLTVSDPTEEVDWGAMSRGISPNAIHSKDTDLKTLTVNRLREKYGVKDFSMIHDSFATHAGNSRLMFEVTKEVFQEMFKGRNWLEELYNHFKKQGVPMLRYKRDVNGRKIKKTVKRLFGGTEEVFETEPIPLSEIRDLGDYDFEDFDKLQYFFH